MNRLKIIIGTVNRFEPGWTQEQREEAYQSSFKPFITSLNSQSKLKAVIYYSAQLLEWFQLHHPEFILLIKELVSHNRLELLSAGYYEPLLSMIPPKDRRSQIEMFANWIRQNFKKRSSGGWVLDGVWEPSFASTYANSGIKYLFLSETIFYKSGISNEQIHLPFLTEDQGKVVTLFPVHEYLVNRMGIISPQKMINSINSLYTQHKEDQYISLIMNGNLLGKPHSELSDFFSGKWINEFYQKCIENSDLFENDLPRNFYKQLTIQKKVYLQCGQAENYCGNMLNLDQAVTLNLLKRHLKENGMFHFVQCGYFRQFLMRYIEADRIYHKQNHVSLMIGQNTKDKARKHMARETLFKAQNSSVFSHGHYAGIYSNKTRKQVYRDLIEAERMTREKGVFHQNLIQTDYNMDGVDEFLYSGQNYNLYISKAGGEAIELDYLPARWNYLDTMSRYREMYHIDSSLTNFDKGPANLFSDLFFRKDFSINNFEVSTLEDCSISNSSLYQLANIDREKRIIKFQCEKEVHANGSVTDILLTKQYRLQKGIEVSYEIENLSDKTVNFHFSSLLNLSFQEDSDKVVFSKIKGSKETTLPFGFKDARSIDAFRIHDQFNSTQIEVTATKKFSLLKESISSLVMNYGELEEIFQHYALLPLWNASIRPKASWKLNLTLNIAKKQN